MMNRRDFINVLSPNIAKKYSFPENPPSNKGLSPYSGEWNFAQAAHLLRRTTFGPNLSQIHQVQQQGLEATIAQLMADVPLPEQPLNADYPADVSTSIGESWVGKPLNSVNKQAHIGNRKRSLRSWTRRVIATEGIHLREKMTLFWHNHFPTREITFPELAYRYVTLLRQHALGNVIDLTKEVTVDGQMLVYLNGNKNVKESPNENYARELLELFTVGKGPLIASGDYTNYTETDVVEGAKILSGWYVKNRNTTDESKPTEVLFRSNKHTLGSKTLSAHFSNTVIAENGAEEYKDFIDVIFTKSTVAQLIVSKIYRFFVYYDITDIVQQNVIDPLAQILVTNNYNVKPVLETLFKSEHFYDNLSMGCMTKSPIDFIETALKQFNWPMPSDLADKYKLDLKLFNLQYKTGMVYYDPPSVAGWKAYYQKPSFHRNWINSATMQRRYFIGQVMSGNGQNVNGTEYKMDFIGLVQTTSQPSMPDIVVSEIASMMLPLIPTDDLVLYLKNILLQNLPDFEWTDEYNNYLANPSDEVVIISLENKIRKFLRAIMALPEYHLS